MASYLSNNRFNIHSSITKFIIRAGELPIPLPMAHGTRVTFHFLTRKCEDKTVIDNSRAMFDMLAVGRPMKFVFGDLDVTLGDMTVWEEIIQTMLVKEVSSFKIDKSLLAMYPSFSMNFREQMWRRVKKRVNRPEPSPNIQIYDPEHDDLNSLLVNPCDLEFIIELLKREDFYEYLHESWKLTPGNEEACFEEANQLKCDGDNFFENKNFSKACEKYSKAIVFLEQLINCKRGDDFESEHEEKLKIRDYLNKLQLIIQRCARCKMYLEKYHEVLELCTTGAEYGGCSGIGTLMMYGKASTYVRLENSTQAFVDNEEL